MATIDQYSEVVAAYGYTLPPPPKAQTNRMVLGLLYAAIGTALGTMTGTGMALVSMQPGGAAAWAHHLSLPNFAPAKTAHASSATAVAKATPAPAPVVAHAATAAAPVETAPVQAAPVQTASLAPAAPSPVARPGIFAGIVSPSVVEAGVDVAPLDRELTLQREAAKAKPVVAPAVHHRAGLVLASASRLNGPPVKVAALRVPAAAPAPSVEQESLDEDQVAPALFYSEGDVTVVDYDATLDTIVTNDGRSFVIGPTVAMSSAASWNDYRSNVHYRCDQGGKCTITRSGVVALSAKQI